MRTVGVEEKMELRPIGMMLTEELEVRFECVLCHPATGRMRNPMRGDVSNLRPLSTLC
jgi:hypothetical protein